mgnify:FL=1
MNTYLDDMQKLIEENLDYLSDPQALSHAFNISFELIYSSFKDKIKNGNRSLCFNDLLYEASQEENPLLACDFEFIKYIHIFNFTNNKTNGAIDIGIDFVSQQILDDCISLDNGISLFKKNTLAVLYNEKNGFFGNNIIEYCHEPGELILDSRSFSTVTSSQNQDGTRNYQFCDLFNYLLLDDEESIQISKDWFDKFEKNNNNCHDITNYFFIQSNSGEGDLFDDNWKYVLYANVGIDGTKANKDCINVFLQKFTQFLDRISIVVLLTIKEYQTIQQSNISAIAQVMSRNMSHNIGSHVYSNLISNDVYSMISDKNVLRIESYVSMFSPKKDSVNTQSTNPSSDNLQVAYFNQYIKNRMDYISEVVLDTPNILTTKYIYNDVFREFDRVRILLNYISGIPNFRYTFCLKYNGLPLTEKNDIAVAFSNDVLGAQALYNIIENIIRNTAKHACCSGQEINTFTIEFKDVDGFQGYYCVEIDNGVKENDIDTLVMKQNKLINESLLDKNNKLRDHGLGVLEMQASAAFLRQVIITKMNPFENLVKDEEKPDHLMLFEAINKNDALGYRFYMPKPKEFLFLGDWGESYYITKTKLINNGIRFITENDFKKDMEKETSYAYPFLLYHENVSKDIKEMLSDDNDCKTLLPLRKLMLDDEDFKYISDEIEKTEFKDIVKLIKSFVWNKYYENIVVKELKNPTNKGLKIRTAFDPNKGDNDFVSNQVIFLNHSYKNTHAAAWQQVSSELDYETWIENLTSRTSAKLPLFREYSAGDDNPVSDYVENIKKENLIKYEIFEAYHNKVIVLDERVQKFANEKFEGSSGDHGGPIPCSKLFESTNVHIPELPLDPKQFSIEDKTKLETFVNERISGAFLLIHYGILERLYKNEKDITKQLNEWASKAKRVVVTSGRGAHSLPLPPSVCFADLSSVLYAFVENRSKFTINDLLNQSRRKHE